MQFIVLKFNEVDNGDEIWLHFYTVYINVLMRHATER